MKTENEKRKGSNKLVDTNGRKNDDDEDNDNDDDNTSLLFFLLVGGGDNFERPRKAN